MRLKIDKISTAQIPDGPYKGSHYAAKSTGNGNCLFNAVSISIKGKPVKFSESILLSFRLINMI